MAQGRRRLFRTLFPSFSKQLKVLRAEALRGSLTPVGPGPTQEARPQGNSRGTGPLSVARSGAWLRAGDSRSLVPSAPSGSKEMV